LRLKHDSSELIQPAAPPSLGVGPDERIVIWAVGSEAEDLLEPY
jgi:hypothetical protein